MVNNYVAHFDMLGFGNAVLEQYDEAWGALSDLWFVMSETLRTVPIPIATGVPLVDKVHSKFFSDSVILYTMGNSDNDLTAILFAAATLFGKSLRKCVPMRGGMGYGKFQVDPEKKIFMGESLVRAYQIGENAQWLGIVVDDVTATAAQRTILSEYVVSWQISGKNGEQTTCSVINWLKPYVDAGSLKKSPITLMELYTPFEPLFGPYHRLEPRIKRKYENTISFMDAHNTY